MPGEVNRMDGNERFRQLLYNGNPVVLGSLLAELGRAEAKKLIEECYREQPETALVYCAKRAGDGKHRKDGDQLECIKLLLSYGAQINETDNSSRTALHWSCWNNNEPLSTILLDNGADPSLLDIEGFNCLHMAVSNSALDCVRLVIGRRKELINRRGGENGVTPLLIAVQKADINVVTSLVTSGADVNCQEEVSERTPLHYALYTKKKDLFEYLLLHGADITKTDHRGTTIIHRCCTIQDASFLKQVLKLGRSFPHSLSTHTPLSAPHTASPLGKALLMGDSEGATPVIVACQNGNLEQLTLLVEAGAPVSNKDKFQRCALHHCVENPATECAEYLLRAIPSLLTCADEEGLTPLHMAVIAGNVPLVKLLLKRGANLQVVDNEKHTVIHWATGQ
ncbi:ankyrin repeat, ph and sec7 domain containing protein secg [Plakobranchus ocellatus]|uniref:Ankyrin repeat, ph and sec7 domain containing protein secg n=1 Tax=Plakobranchus ocellatus TaxID=259542 RepID=A0AAV4B144_9GAST|nr:ankyrin repeat, ph and sec7 domain containing protein secg [Plakobranchus ocellatus]